MMTLFTEMTFEVRLKSQKAGRFEKLLSFVRSHFIVTRGSVSL